MDIQYCDRCGDILQGNALSASSVGNKILCEKCRPNGESSSDLDATVPDLTLSQAVESSNLDLFSSETIARKRSEDKSKSGPRLKLVENEAREDSTVERRQREKVNADNVALRTTLPGKAAPGSTFFVSAGVKPVKGSLKLATPGSSRAITKDGRWRIHCPDCEARLGINPLNQRSKLRCPKCQASLVVEVDQTVRLASEYAKKAPQPTKEGSSPNLDAPVSIEASAKPPLPGGARPRSAAEVVSELAGMLRPGTAAAASAEPQTPSEPSPAPTPSPMSMAPTIVEPVAPVGDFPSVDKMQRETALERATSMQQSVEPVASETPETSTPPAAVVATAPPPAAEIPIPAPRTKTEEGSFLDKGTAPAPREFRPPPEAAPVETKKAKAKAPKTAAATTPAIMTPEQITLAVLVAAIPSFIGIGLVTFVDDPVVSEYLYAFGRTIQAHMREVTHFLGF